MILALIMAIAVGLTNMAGGFLAGAGGDSVDRAAGATDLLCSRRGSTLRP